MNNDEPSSSSSTHHHQQLRPASPSTSSLYLSPKVPQYAADSDSDRAASPEPDSPSASTFLRTAATLDGLARQLGDLNHSRESSLDDEFSGKCCCGSLTGSRGCRTMIERDRMEDKMKLGGEIGQALLARYEVLETKFRKEVERYEHQLSVKRKSLEDSVKRVRNLEKANTQHLQQYADMSRKNEALEKRYTQSLHTQTLTQQSLTHVRAELAALRENTTRQNIALASGAGLEQQLMDAERRCEEARDNAEVERRNAKDEARKRKRAEVRVGELEEEVKRSAKEVEEVKEARARDAQDLLNNAKERLAILHSELSETFRGDTPNERPEYQKALEDLVAANTLLKHDTSELSAMLAESREETRLLREEVGELRMMHPSPVPGHYRPLALAAELSQSRNSASHSRTESSPMVGTFAERLGWSRMSTSSSIRSGGWDHGRQNSMVPSIASSTAGEGGPLSPGLGMGQVGEYAGHVQREDGIISPTNPSGRESPRPVFRASPSGALGYVVNGVPKKAQRPGPQRTYSVDQRRSYFAQGAETIVEDPSSADATSEQHPRSPASPGTSYFAAAEANRKRRSLLLSRRNTMSPYGSTNDPYDSATNTADQTSTQVDFPSPMSESAVTSPQKEKRVQRKTLLLLSRSRGVQTEPEEMAGQSSRPGMDNSRRASGYTDQSTDTAANAAANTMADAASETSSLHESATRTSSSNLLVLVEHLAKILAKLRSADIPTLNKRLKRQNLPGDVGHLSRSTMRALEAEVADLRQLSRGLGDNTILSRRDFTLLLKLIKDVFSELISLQTVVNDVTVDPHLAKKLQKAAYRDEEDEANKAKQGTGLGWIAAPITKFFVTPAGDSETTPAENPVLAGRSADRGRLQPAPIRASKQLASTSATTTHVSVEFGGAGIVRRNTPAVSTTSATASGSSVRETLPPSPRETLDQPTVPGHSDSSATLRVPKPLHRSKSRANRNELLGIFAGAQRSVPPAGGPWHVVTGPPGSGNSKTIRAVSSTYFGDKTGKPGRTPEERRRLPSAVDAVIDSSADQLQDADPLSFEEQIQSSLLERQLRPRGLSDSSIRSTFKSHANVGELGITSSGPAARQSAYGTINKSKPAAVGGGGILESLSNRFYSFRGGPSADISPVNPPVESTAASAGSTPALDGPEVKILPSTPLPTKPIAVSPSSSRRPLSPTTTGSTSNTGFLGMLAGSMNADGDPEERVGDMAAKFRQASAVPRSLSASRGGKAWE